MDLFSSCNVLSNFTDGQILLRHFSNYLYFPLPPSIFPNYHLHKGTGPVDELWFFQLLCYTYSQLIYLLLQGCCVPPLKGQELVYMCPVSDAFHFVKPDWAKFIILGEIYKCWAKFWPKFRNSEGFLIYLKLLNLKMLGEISPKILKW